MISMRGITSRCEGRSTEVVRAVFIDRSGHVRFLSHGGPRAGFPAAERRDVDTAASVTEEHSGDFCNALNVSWVGASSIGKLCGLQVRTMGGEHGHLLLRHGLHDVVNVAPLTARMRPKTIVDLVGFDELVCDERCAPEKRSKLSGFFL
jgi:hypothetical protein